MKTITQDNMNAINNAKLNASKDALSEMLSNIIVLTGKESHSDLKDIIKSIRKGKLDDVTLVTDTNEDTKPKEKLFNSELEKLIKSKRKAKKSTSFKWSGNEIVDCISKSITSDTPLGSKTELTDHKINFIEKMTDYFNNLPEDYLAMVEDKSYQYSLTLEVMTGKDILKDVITITYDTLSSFNRVSKPHLIGEIRARLPRPKISQLNSRNYEHSMLRFSAELLQAVKNTGLVAFELKKAGNEIYVPIRSGYPVLLSDEVETSYNHLRGIATTPGFQGYLKMKGSKGKVKIDKTSKQYLKMHSDMDYRIRRWLNKDDISRLVELEMDKELRDYDLNESENKGDRMEIITRFETMYAQLMWLKSLKSFKIKRMLDSRGRIYSMWDILYTKLGKSLIEPVNSYTMDAESMKEVQYHAYCTVHGKVPYEEAIAKYTNDIESIISSRCSNSLQSINDQETAYEWIINKELITMLNTPIGGLCFTNIGADYTNIGLMTHAAMSGDAKALNMANLGDNSKQYDSHSEILDKYLSLAGGDADCLVDLIVTLVREVEPHTTRETLLSEYQDVQTMLNNLRGTMRKGVKKLVSQGLFHGQTSQVLADNLGITKKEAIKFKKDVFGEAIVDVERIALWMRGNIDHNKSYHTWLAPDGVKCYSQYYVKSAYSTLYTNNPSTKEGYSTSQYICELPLLRVGKKWYSKPLPDSSRIETSVNVFKLMGGYANITHSWDAYNMRSIIRLANESDTNVLDIHDYVYSTPKMVKAARGKAKSNYYSYIKQNGNYFNNVMHQIANKIGVTPIQLTSVKRHSINMENNNCFTV